MIRGEKIATQCYWHDKSVNDPDYCRFYKKYIDSCESFCEAYMSKKTVEQAMYIVVRNQQRKNREEELNDI